MRFLSFLLLALISIRCGALIAGPAGPTPTNTVVNIRVDALANRKPINPEIYGVAFASAADLTT